MEPNDILKYISTRYRDPDLAGRLIDRIKELAKYLDNVLIMHVCGTHEWTITHYGIRALLPRNVEVRAGPGCPVCILPAEDIYNVIRLGLEEGLQIITYGDVSRAKGLKGLSLEDARAEGLRLRIVYSFQDAVRIALRDKNVMNIFFAVGFDTTAPSTAYILEKGLPDNLLIYSCYRYVPPSVGYLLLSDDILFDGIINPGHSSTVTGMKPYKKYFDYKPIPMVFSGFEPIDILISIYQVLKQLRDRSPRMYNEYTRSVTWEGNVKAMKTLFKVFNLDEGLWRGLGIIDDSAFEVRDKFREYDARFQYGLEKPSRSYSMPKGCRCADIIKGKATPTECPLYLKACSLENPIGPCMVSVEGTCRIWAEHKIIGEIYGG